MKRPDVQRLRMVGVRDVRDINQTMFLHLIRERQPVSRAELAKATGLRAGTVSAIVNRLLEGRLIYEGVAGPSSGGRPPTYLYINAENAYVLALDIGVRETLFAVSDFNGRILIQQAMLTEGQPERFLRTLADSVQKIAHGQFPRARFEAVGVSVPGLVDRATGTVVVSTNLDWKDVPVRALLESRLDLPVYVENDANAAAFAELWYGPLEEVKARTILFVLVVEGLGTGLIINGELHVGTPIGLGGFGHMSIDPAGPACSCGRRGCWEVFASDRATLARYRKLAGRRSGRSGRAGHTSINDVITLAQHGDTSALTAVRETANYLGEGIANLAHGLSPEIIVVGGAIAAAWPVVGPILMERVKSRYILPNIAPLTIRPSSVQRPSLFGAIPIALQHCFGSNRPTLQARSGKH
jgi:predicted NBD/HSP70 family sugar kinase